MKKNEKHSYRKEYKFFKKVENIIQLKQNIGLSTNQRGFNAENVVIKSFSDEIYSKNCPVRPEWFYKIEKASYELDSKGIDLIVFTDVGKIFLQVKSSLKGKEEFLRKKKNRIMIGIVIIKYYESFETIRYIIIKELEKMRNLILEKRNY
jgi:hypothetical protein